MKPTHLALAAAAALGAAVVARQPVRPFDLLTTNARILGGSVAPQKPTADRRWSDFTGYYEGIRVDEAANASP